MHSDLSRGETQIENLLSELRERRSDLRNHKSNPKNRPRLGIIDEAPEEGEASSEAGMKPKVTMPASRSPAVLLVSALPCLLARRRLLLLLLGSRPLVRCLPSSREGI